MSRAAVQKLRDAFENHPNLFSGADTFADDLELSLTLRRLGIETQHTLDAEGRQVFLALGLEEERGVTRERDGGHWIWQYDPSFRQGINCCSKSWIATHYIGS